MRLIAAYARFKQNLAGDCGAINDHIGIHAKRRYSVGAQGRLAHSVLEVDRHVMPAVRVPEVESHASPPSNNIATNGTSCRTSVYDYDTSNVDVQELPPTSVHV